LNLFSNYPAPFFPNKALGLPVPALQILFKTLARFRISMTLLQRAFVIFFDLLHHLLV
jgi:hypothetical protein